MVGIYVYINRYIQFTSYSYDCQPFIIHCNVFVCFWLYYQPFKVTILAKIVRGVFTIEFSNFIKNKRLSKKLSIREFAKVSGVSHPYISQIENGKINKPSTDTLRKLAEGLNVPYIEMLWEAGLFDLYEREKYKEALEDFSTKEDFVEMVNRLKKLENSIQADKIEQVKYNEEVTEQIVNEKNLYDLNRILKQISKPVTFNTDTLTDDEKELLHGFIELLIKTRKEGE